MVECMNSSIENLGKVKIHPKDNEPAFSLKPGVERAEKSLSGDFQTRNETISLSMITKRMQRVYF